MCDSGPGDLDGVEEALDIPSGRLAGDSSAARNLEARRGYAPSQAFLGAHVPDQAVEESTHERIPRPGRIGNAVRRYCSSLQDAVGRRHEGPIGPGRNGDATHASLPEEVDGLLRRIDAQERAWSRPGS